MYIFNEEDYIRGLLVSKNKPSELSTGYLIVLVAKYYYKNTEDIYVDELIDIVKNKIVEFNIENYQEYKWFKKIEDTCESLFEFDKNEVFKKIEYIPIYQKEIDRISTLKNDREKKFLFTVYAIARYMNCNGWTNKKTSEGLSEIFKLANIGLTQDKKDEMLYKLFSNGYISMGKKIDNLNIRVELEDGSESEIAYKIIKFENIGNQYIGNFKKGYKQCRSCGKKIKDTGNRKMYCSECAKKINRDKTKLRMKTLRNV